MNHDFKRKRLVEGDNDKRIDQVVCKTHEDALLVVKEIPTRRKGASHERAIIAECPECIKAQEKESKARIRLALGPIEHFKVSI